MEHAHKDSLNVDSEQYEHWKEFVLTKIDGHEKAMRLVRDTKNGSYVHKTNICAMFGIDTRSPKFEATMKVLCETYPHIFSGANW